MNKALESDQIFNKVLKIIMHNITGHLKHIINDFITMSYYSAHFEEFIIVILYKQGNTRDFISSKSYWLISLLNIVRKTIEAVLVTEINYMAIVYNFLSKMHFGGQYRLYIKTAIYYLSEKIYTA